LAQLDRVVGHVVEPDYLCVVDPKRDRRTISLRPITRRINGDNLKRDRRYNLLATGKREVDTFVPEWAFRVIRVVAF